MNTLHRRQRQREYNDWLDRAARADEVIGWTLVVIGVITILNLIIERFA